MQTSNRRVKKFRDRSKISDVRRISWQPFLHMRFNIDSERRMHDCGSSALERDKNDSTSRRDQIGHA